MANYLSHWQKRLYHWSVHLSDCLWAILFVNGLPYDQGQVHSYRQKSRRTRQICFVEFPAPLRPPPPIDSWEVRHTSAFIIYQGAIHILRNADRGEGGSAQVLSMRFSLIYVNQNFDQIRYMGGGGVKKCQFCCYVISVQPPIYFLDSPNWDAKTELFPLSIKFQ